MPSPGKLGILVRNATEEFGFAPREVFNGVFGLPITIHGRATAVKRLTYSKLMALSKAFSCDYELDGFSDRVVAVQPREFTFRRDHWTNNFKSARIARKVVESMRLLGPDQPRDTHPPRYPGQF